MEVNIGDLLDRLSIVQLKSERIDAQRMKPEMNDLEAALKEVKAEQPQLVLQWEDVLGLLKMINGHIWDLEADIRQGKEGQLGLEEVGRRAIMIRDLNSLRVWVKNLVIGLSGRGHQDVKKAHASE